MSLILLLTADIPKFINCCNFEEMSSESLVVLAGATKAHKNTLIDNTCRLMDSI